MSYCKKCHKHISADCFLDIGICVFCYYKTSEWESNGAIVTKKEAIKDGERIFRYFHSTENLVKKAKSRAKIFKSGKEFSRHIKKLSKK